ncbi:outer membrane protein assembly factor BamB family protein [Dokdonella sp. MW10]|uniref:outer membrane protein assembly factor BamB family protein n=1 Tax=Dokdonella sp. MW10 TaxID=2992926 RepID=UPI003F7F6142
MRNRRIEAATAALLLVSSYAPQVLAGNPAWSVVTDAATGPAPWSRNDARPDLIESPGGPFLPILREVMNDTPSVVKLEASGATRWRTTLPHHPEAGRVPQRVVAGPDGSALVIGAAVSLLDADGHVSWSTVGRQWEYQVNVDKIDTGVVLDDGSVVLAVRSGTRTVFRHHDAATGRLLATMRVAQASSDTSCGTRAMAGDGTAVYAVVGCTSRLIRLDIPTASIAWSVDLPITALLVDTSSVYVSSDSTLRKISTADGQTLWSVDGPEGGPAFDALVRMADGSILGRRGATLEALDAATGATRWTHAAAGSLGLPTVGAGGVLVPGRDAAPSGNTPIAYVAALDPEDGSLLWRADAVSPEWDELIVDRAVADGADIVAVGTRCRRTEYGETCEVATWHGSAGTSAPWSASPVMVPSGVVATWLFDQEGGTALAAALEWGSAGQQLHLREYRLADGTLIAESTRPAPMPVLSSLSSTRLEIKRNAHGDVAVLVAGGPYWYGGTGTDATVMRIDGAGGATLWQRPLLDHASGQIDVAASLAAIDSYGHVVVAVHEGFPKLPWGAPSQDVRHLTRHASADGAILWRKTFAPPSPLWVPTSYPPSAYALGDDLIQLEPALGESAYGIARISGDDGSVTWSRPPAGGMTHVPDAGTIVHTTFNDVMLAVTSIDASTGSTRWSTPPIGSTTSRYSPYAAITSAAQGGRIIVGGRRVDSSLPAPGGRGFITMLDATTGAVVWSNDLADSPFGAIATANPKGVVDGILYATQQRSFPTSEYVLALTGFDAATGEPVGTRPALRQSLNQPHRDDRGGFVWSLGTDGQVALASNLHARHDAPPALSIARHALAAGSRSELHVSLDVAAQAAGDGLVLDLVATTRNDGPDAVDDVDAMLVVPQGVVVEAVTCTLDGVPCTAVERATSIEVRRALPAGAVLVVSARFLWDDGSAMLDLGASAFGPFSTVETRLDDNVATHSLRDRIMRTGFE